MNFGIIGYGNIGRLISKNLESIGFLEENNIYISSRTLENINSNFTIFENNVELAKNSDIVFISVRSTNLIEVIDEIVPFIKDNSYIVHSSAGISFEDIANVYEGEVSCVIPSIASEANGKRGISIFYHNKNTTETNKQKIENLFSKFSHVIATDSYGDLEALTVVTSCMPAFIALATDLFAKELSKYSNLNYKDVYNYLNETNYSTANLLNLETFDSNEMINKVATKKGITQKGLDYLKKELPDIFDNLMKSLND